jgi:type I restriction enzyme M protein
MLFPYLAHFNDQGDHDLQTITAIIFRSVRNHISSDNTLYDIIRKLNPINFNVFLDQQITTEFYDSLLTAMLGSAYISQPIVHFIIDRLQPQLGENVLDPNCTMAEFLVEAYEQLKDRVQTPEQQEQLQNSLVGIDNTSATYIFSALNMLLHGITIPRLLENSMLTVNPFLLPDQYLPDIIVTRLSARNNKKTKVINSMPAGTSAEILQRAIQTLRRPGGRGCIVLPTNFLTEDTIAITFIEPLLTRFHLHTIVNLPTGLFSPYTTNPVSMLFFESDSEPDRLTIRPTTEEVWFYEIPLPEGRDSYTITSPLQSSAFEGCVNWWNNRIEDEHAWKVSINRIQARDYKLDFQQPREEK